MVVQVPLRVYVTTHCIPAWLPQGLYASNVLWQQGVAMAHVLSAIRSTYVAQAQEQSLSLAHG